MYLSDFLSWARPPFGPKISVACLADLSEGGKCHDSKNLNVISMLITSSCASLRYKGASCACVLCFEFNFVFGRICAC